MGAGVFAGAGGTTSTGGATRCLASTAASHHHQQPDPQDQRATAVVAPAGGGQQHHGIPPPRRFSGPRNNKAAAKPKSASRRLPFCGAALVDRKGKSRNQEQQSLQLMLVLLRTTMILPFSQPSSPGFGIRSYPQPATTACRRKSTSDWTRFTAFPTLITKQHPERLMQLPLERTTRTIRTLLLLAHYRWKI